MLRSVFLVVFILCFQNVISQPLPSFPERYVWDYYEPDIPDSAKEMKIEISFKSSDSDSLITKSIYQFYFTNEGLLKRKNIIDPATRNRISSFVFDEFERIVRIENQESVFSRYIYDDDSLTSRWVRYTNSGEPFQRVKFHYETSRKQYRPILKKTYRESGELADSSTYDYNERGDLVREISHNTPHGYGITIDGSITGSESESWLNKNDTTTYQYSYDSSGFTTSKITTRFGEPAKKETFINSGDTLITTIEKYRSFDKDLWKVEKIIKEVDSLRVEFLPLSRAFDDITWIYKNDLRIKTISHKNGQITDKIIFSYKDVYDSKGNLISRMKYRDEELIQMTTREIEFY